MNIVLEMMRYKIYECTVVNNDGVGVIKFIISRRALTMTKGKTIKIKLLNNDFGLNIEK